jgi:periplasmic divalent cation tolerance protein
MSEPEAIVSVYATFGSAEEAHRIGRAMIEARRAACVNILGRCHSIFRWEGEVDAAEEVAALFKTTAREAPGLIEAIAELHSYDVPAAVVWPIAGALESYRAWVVENSGR